MSTPYALPHPGLNARQVETVERLFAATEALLDEMPYDELTIRLIAARAGLSPATAYTYFSSKDHLFATLYWRLVATAEGPELAGDPRERLRQVVRWIAALVGASPALATAANKSLLGGDPAVAELRLAIGRHFVGLFAEALGEDARPGLVRTLEYVLTGAMVEAGAGIVAFDDLAEELVAAVDIVTG
ncbi:TetR/AcrR family transcriptional regulator [Nocardioides sp. YIM 152588]|uniref:TetR/AcrR family transcriptional regulator n=1 Tax=Nocardioides sp. YIM 152588 TaxID=3158259 RepID=UPI0032E40F2F